MTHQPPKAKVAVITRTKDRALLLERAIKSVHSQTMTDFIHVIINDAGSRAAVDDLLKKYASLVKDRVKVIHNDVSKGMEAASNKAIKSVSSTYVAVHDDDDSWHPDFLKQTTDHMEKTGAKGVVVTTDQVIEEIKNDKVITKEVKRWLPELREINLYKQCRDNYATPITFIYRREVYDEIGYYDEALPVAGDWDFALRFLLKYDIDFLPTKEALAYYHHRPTSSGVNVNSVFEDGGSRHKKYLNILANKHLRSELAAGKMGVGYIINSLLDQQDKENERRQWQEGWLQRLRHDLSDEMSHKLQAQKDELVKDIDRQRQQLADLVHARTSVKERFKSFTKS